MKKQIEISAIVCAVTLLLGSGACQESARRCKNNDECVVNASCSTETGWCAFWKSQLTASRSGDWKDAIIGNPYEVEYTASGGFPPYTWTLNDGQVISQLEWLTLVTEGDNNENAKLQNKTEQTPWPRDIDTSGILINITVKDYTKPGNKTRIDNQGFILSETLKITGCTDNSCVVCKSAQKRLCEIKDFGTANCDSITNKIQRCWADTDGCIVWQDQPGLDCSRIGTCTVAGDGTVICACNDKFAGDKCDQCAVAYTDYPDCRNTKTILLEGISFNMRWVPGGTFPTGMNDDGISKVDAGFWMGETEVTYELWFAVRRWAEGYMLANLGKEGSEGDIGLDPKTTGIIAQPVTMINWRDAMVWCNIASESAGLTQVYYIDEGYTLPIQIVDNNPIDTAAGHEDNPYVKSDANGFRLPESMEWECAARYHGTDKTNTVQATIKNVNFASPTDGVYWTKGDSASGAVAAYTDFGASSAVAWFGNSTDQVTGNTTTTQPVKVKNTNALGINDMSGNVQEWCFDWYVSDTALKDSLRVIRGGDFSDPAWGLQVGSVGGLDPSSGINVTGFRLVMTK